MIHELTGANAEAWLCAGVGLMRLTRPSAASLADVTPALLAGLAEWAALPSAGVVADFAGLASGAHADFLRPHSDWPERLRLALRGYEDQLLARLAAEGRMLAVQDAVARLPAELRGGAAAQLMGAVLTRLGWRGGAAVSPALARRVFQRSSEEVLATSRAVLLGGGDLVETLAESYEGLARAARGASALLGDADVFLLENLTVLQTPGQRLATAQAVECAEALERELPRRLKPSVVPTGPVPTEVSDEASYPIGGFASLSNSGSLENLVTSELAYMDDGDAEIDLFDVRYVESELLYYTRDESVFVRRRRVVTLALSPSLIRARFKDPGARWQRLVLVLGWLLATLRKLTGWLNETEGLLFRVVFLADETGESPLASEQQLCTLLLREWIERDIVELGQAPGLDAVLARAAEDARAARVDVVLISAQEEALPERDARVGLNVLDVSQPLPTVRGVSSSAGWQEASLELLKRLL